MLRASMTTQTDVLFKKNIRGTSGAPEARSLDENLRSDSATK